MGILKALIFDVDGTFAETERARLAAFNLAFRDAGLGGFWSVQLYTELLSVFGSTERLKYFISRHQPPLIEHGDLEALVMDWREAKDRHYADMVRRGEVKLRPGVARLLREG